MSSQTSTARMTPRGVFVMLVHDNADVAHLCEALRSEFIVREVTSAFDALERLTASPLACVVCVLGGAIRAEDFFTLVSRASPQQARRVVFVADRVLDATEAAFLRDKQMHWLTAPAEPQELLAVVRAVSALKAEPSPSAAGA